MYETQYHRATSLSEAAQLLSQSGEEAKFLGGGMTLIPTMKARLAAPSALIDLRHVPEMKGITVEGRSVRIGGGVTHFEVANSAAIEAVAPGFTELAQLIGDPAVRHMGTIGGVCANFDPAADYPAALLALNGTIETDRGNMPPTTSSSACSRRRWVTARSSRACGSKRRMPRPTRSSATRPRAMPCAASMSPSAAAMFASR